MILFIPIFFISKDKKFNISTHLQVTKMFYADIYSKYLDFLKSVQPGLPVQPSQDSFSTFHQAAKEKQEGKNKSDSPPLL